MTDEMDRLRKMAQQVLDGTTVLVTSWELAEEVLALPKFYTYRQVAVAADVSVSTVHNWVLDSKIVGYRVMGLRVVTRESYEYLANMESYQVPSDPLPLLEQIPADPVKRQASADRTYLHQKRYRRERYQTLWKEAHRIVVLTSEGGRRTHYGLIRSVVSDNPQRGPQWNSLCGVLRGVGVPYDSLLPGDSEVTCFQCSRAARESELDLTKVER